MTRLIRIPVLRWGDLDAVEAFVHKHQDSFQADASIQFSRLRWGVEIDKVTKFDFDYVLEPVTKKESQQGQTLTDPMDPKRVAQVVQRCGEVADRFDIENRKYDDVFIDNIVRREIKAGIEKGTM